MKYSFDHGSQLLDLCGKYHMPISQVMLLSEQETSERPRQEILGELAGHLQTMKESVRAGLDRDHPVRGTFVGGDALKLEAHAAGSYMGEPLARTAAAAMAVVEVNASMGIVVAAPTAGASGILPAVLLVYGQYRGFSDEEMIEGLLTAGAVGKIIAENSSIAGASGGCQAETGTASAMAAAALAQLSGAGPAQALDAAAICLENVMGQICDPVAGLVECPWVKRNAIGAVNAVLSCDMVLAGIASLIPFDEVVLAMKNVGMQMHPDLKETARGGIAATPTGKKMAQKILQR